MKCFNCGEDHMISHCNLRKKEISSKLSTNLPTPSVIITKHCDKCGRNNHKKYLIYPRYF